MPAGEIRLLVAVEPVLLGDIINRLASRPGLVVDLVDRGAPAPDGDGPVYDLAIVTGAMPAGRRAEMSVVLPGGAGSPGRPASRGADRRAIRLVLSALEAVMAGVD